MLQLIYSNIGLIDKVNQLLSGYSFLTLENTPMLPHHKAQPELYFNLPQDPTHKPTATSLSPWQYNYYTATWQLF